jgi:alpha-N-acetylglucosaminidase
MNHSRTEYTATPEGDSYAAAMKIARELHLTPSSTPNRTLEYENGNDN